MSFVSFSLKEENALTKFRQGTVKQTFKNLFVQKKKIKTNKIIIEYRFSSNSQK